MMVRIAETSGFASNEFPLELYLDTPNFDSEESSALVLVERMDRSDEEFNVELEGMEAEQIGTRPTQAQLWITNFSHFGERIGVKIRCAAGGGWFRARIVWLKGKIPHGKCLLCRKTIAAVVAASFAVVGIPMPDLLISEIDEDMMKGLIDSIRGDPVGTFIKQIHSGLPDILCSALEGFDLIASGLNRLYRFCCKKIDLC